jgi:hypothetical protein
VLAGTSDAMVLKRRRMVGSGEEARRGTSAVGEGHLIVGREKGL